MRLIKARRLAGHLATSVRPTSGQSITNTTFPFLYLTFAVADIDQLGMWIPGVATDRLIVNEPGTYLVTANWAHNGTRTNEDDHIVGIDFRNSGGTNLHEHAVRYAGRHGAGGSASTVLVADAGDYFRVLVYQATGSTRTTSPQACNLSALKVS